MKQNFERWKTIFININGSCWSFCISNFIVFECELKISDSWCLRCFKITTCSGSFITWPFNRSATHLLIHSNISISLLIRIKGKGWKLCIGFFLFLRCKRLTHTLNRIFNVFIGFLQLLRSTICRNLAHSFGSLNCRHSLISGCKILRQKIFYIIR